jgi:hypothetical protein
LPGVNPQHPRSLFAKLIGLPLRDINLHPTTWERADGGGDPELRARTSEHDVEAAATIYEAGLQSLKAGFA